MSSSWKIWRVRLIALAVAGSGLLNVISSIWLVDPNRLRLLREVVSPDISFGSRSLTIVAGFFLITLALNLAGRRWAAWIIVVYLLLLSTILHLLKGIDIEEALFSVGLLLVLGIFRHDFSVRSNPKKVQSILFALPFALIFFIAYAIVGFWLLQRRFTPPDFDLGQVAQETIALAAFQDSHNYHPRTRQAMWFAESIPLVAVLSVLYVIYELMSPMFAPPPESQTDRERLSRLVGTYATSAVGYLATTTANYIFWSSNHQTAISYVVKNGVALAIGDPIGPAENISQIIGEFKHFCVDQGFIPSFYYVSQNLEAAYKQQDFNLLEIGSEAIVDLSSFSYQQADRDIRKALNKGQRLGWQLKIFKDAITDNQYLVQIAAISQAWLAGKNGGEMGFSVGGTPILGSPQTLTALAVDAQNQVLAILTFAPIPATTGWVGDHMRRRPDAPNGVLEFAFGQMIDYLKNQGFRYLSLGLAPTQNHVESDQRLLSLTNIVQKSIDRFYHSKSLYLFKNQFVPTWEKKYLAYANILQTPQIARALLTAHFPKLSLKTLAKALV